MDDGGLAVKGLRLRDISIRWVFEFWILHLDLDLVEKQFHNTHTETETETGRDTQRATAGNNKPAEDKEMRIICYVVESF